MWSYRANLLAARTLGIRTGAVRTSNVSVTRNSLELDMDGIAHLSIAAFDMEHELD
jgi:hypothetical protein